MTIDEINAILHECIAEVLTWSAWKHSDDVMREFPKLYDKSSERAPEVVLPTFERNLPPYEKHKIEHETAQDGSLRGPGPIEAFTTEHQRRSGEGRSHLVRDMISRKKHGRA